MTVNVPKMKHIHGIPHILSNKNMENSGNQAEFHLKGDNIGYQLLVKQGWNEQSGLGSNEDGKLYPVRVNYKHDKKGDSISHEEYTILSNMNKEFHNVLPNPSPTVSQLRKHQKMVETLELAKKKGLILNHNDSSSTHNKQKNTLNKVIKKPYIKKKDFKKKIQKEEKSRLKLLEYLKN
ncbi:hypothetical protein PIROE2DRAFT_61431 [Piromyces sp. E2]|nr:hypothetical protein PIROE2DRAFT_61431 [Piromyces sp. E2]|eukprot:OUM63220.1 hypothetical protein PIROE2DRAFT_61431 [Piromyces sp. E2]